MYLSETGGPVKGLPGAARQVGSLSVYLLVKEQLIFTQSNWNSTQWEAVVHKRNCQLTIPRTSIEGESLSSGLNPFESHDSGNDCFCRFMLSL